MINRPGRDAVCSGMCVPRSLHLLPGRYNLISEYAGSCILMVSTYTSLSLQLMYTMPNSVLIVSVCAYLLQEAPQNGLKL